MARKQAKTGKKRRERRIVLEGVAHVRSTFNNTIVSITDRQGEVISWASAGSAGFKGSKKGTPFAAQLAAELAARKAMDSGMRKVDVIAKGTGGGKDTAIRSLATTGLDIGDIRDATPIPHNGCRPKKRRRV